MKNQSCDSFILEDFLDDDCDVQAQSELEQHLERCEKCQSRLSLLAADDELWTQAATHLSTVEQIVLPNRISEQLAMSGSFLVPEVSRKSDHLATSATNLISTRDWTQILDPPSHPEMLGRIDQFEIESKIGQGGMGIVLKGFDRELNRAVAIKILSPQLAANGTARQRFAREAEAAAAVMHPNVVPIYSVNKSPERPYIVMQLVPGHSLQSLVQEKGPLKPTDVVRISMQIAAGLSAAHKLGLIHRDVKPSNMLVERDVSRVMITDFGLARAANDAGMTQTGWLAGTPHYMSPEQTKGDEVDTRNDLFSLGSLMYFIATGREPFRGDRPYAVIQKIVNQQPDNPMALNREIPATLSDIIEKLLEKDPKNRFQSAAEVFDLLEQYLAYLQHPTQARPPKRILTSRRKRKRAWMIGVAFLTTCLVAGGVAWFNNGSIWNRVGQETTNADGAVGDENFSSEPKSVDLNSDSPTIPTGFATNGFGIDDDAFSHELLDVEQALDSLEQSLRSNSPAGVYSWPSNPPGLSDDQFESKNDRFESNSDQLNGFNIPIEKNENPNLPENRSDNLKKATEPQIETTRSQNDN